MAMLARVTLSRPMEWVQFDAKDAMVSGNDYRIQSRCGEDSFFYIGVTPNETDFEVLEPLQMTDIIYTGVPVWGMCPTLPGSFAVYDMGSPPALDSSIQTLISAVKAQSALASTVWYDPTTVPPTYYVRREVMNETTGDITITWETPTGTPVVPPNVDALVPVSNAENIETESVTYTATAAGPGYAAGDVLIHTFGIDTAASPPVVAYSIWFNAGPSVPSGSVLPAAPAAGTYTPTVQPVAVESLPLPPNAAQETGGNLQAIAQATGTQADAAYAGAGSSTIIAALKGIYAAIKGTLNIRALSSATDSVTVTGNVGVSGNVNVGNWPANQPVSVSNFPATQQVAGTVNVGNLPATQQVAGTVTVVQPAGAALNATVSGTVGITSVARNAGFSSTSGSGSVAAGSVEVSFANGGSATATVAGGSLPPNYAVTFSAPKGDTLNAIAYNANGSTLLISTVT